MIHKFITLIVVMGIIAPQAYAADYASQSFIARNPMTTDFGGTSSSTSFSSVSGGGEISNLEASSTNFIVNAGPMFFDSFSAFSQNWRWYGDADNETPTLALGNENTAPTVIDFADPIKLRIKITETSGYSLVNAKFGLEFSTSSVFADGGTTVAEIGDCNPGAKWCYADGGGTDNDVITSALLSDADACVGGTGDGCGTHNESSTTTSSFMHLASTTVEYEFTIEGNGADTNTVYYFRAIDPSGVGVPLNAGETYPSLLTGGAILTFAIEGLPSATTTEGVTTEIETTSTAIPFGTLMMNDPVIAAHRFTVSTNAANGYKIFAYQRQGLLSPYTEIQPVSGTNAAPSGWATGCGVGAASCYGYHAGEDVLEGGSTRFAANDTFARFTSFPDEIAYSATPVTGKSTDIVYKIEARQLQEAGEYSGSLVFIVTPVF